MNKSLASFLSSTNRPEGTMTYAELHGFLFAVACSPEPVEPTDWLAMIFNEEDANFSDEAEAESVIKGIVDAYNEIHEELQQGDAVLPTCCSLLKPALSNLAEDSTLALWSRGFLDGNEWLSELWEAYVPDELDDELGSCLTMLFFFSSQELAEAFCTNTDASLEQLAEVALDNFEAAMTSYAHIGNSIRQAIAVMDQEKITENDLTQNTGCYTYPESVLGPFAPAPVKFEFEQLPQIFRDKFQLQNKVVNNFI